MYFDTGEKSAGMIIDICRLWAKKINADVSFIPAEGEAAFEMVRKGQADFAIGIFSTGEAPEGLMFWRKDLDIETSLFVSGRLFPTRDVDVKRLTIGILDNPESERYIRDNFHGARITRRATADELITLAESGSINAFVLDSPVAMYYLSRHDVLGKYRQTRTLHTSEIRALLKSGNREMMHLLESGFMRIGMQEIETVYQDWAGYSPLIPSWVYHQMFFFAVLFLFAVLIIFVVLLRFKVRSRTVKLQAALEEIQLKNSELEREIAERASAENALAGERNLLRTIIDNIPDFIFVTDERGRMLILNSAAMKSLGLADRNDVIGKCMSSLFDKKLLEQCVMFEDRLLKGDAPIVTLELNYSEKMGEEVWLQETAVALRDAAGTKHGMVCISRDISSLKETQLALAQTLHEMEGFIETIPDLFFVFDADNRLIKWNRRFEEISGVGPEGLLNHDMITLFPEAKQPDLMTLADDMKKKGGGSFELDIVISDGTHHFFDFMISRLDNQKSTRSDFVGIGRDITERHDNEKALEESEQKLKSVFENMQDAFYRSDNEGRMTWYSPSTAKILGYDNPEELLNVDIAQTLYVRPGERALLIEELKRRRQITDRELEFKRKDGSHFFVSINSRMITDSEGNTLWIEGSFRDITERKEAEEAIRQSEERFRNIFEMMDVAIWELDYSDIEKEFHELHRRGITDYRSYMDAHPEFVEKILKLPKVENMNEASLKLYGAKSKEELSSSLEKIFLPESVDSFKEIAAAVAEGRHYYETESVRSTLQGEIINVIIRIRVPRDEDALSNILITTIDITSQKRHEEELHRAKVDAELANKSKSVFLANMSHELRTPLNSVIAMSDMLVEKYFGELNDQQEEYIRDIRESGQHLLNLINDILDLSKVEAGYSPLELGSIDIEELLRNSLVVVRERALKHSIGLDLKIEGSLPEIIADERKVKQIIYNLLSNAVKFTQENGKVGIEARTREDCVEICVWDNGIGISETDRDRIFGEFYQAEETLTKKYEGTGLGLSLVKRFVEQHGGTIDVESNVGRGKPFQVYTYLYRT